MSDATEGEEERLSEAEEEREWEAQKAETEVLPPTPAEALQMAPISMLDRLPALMETVLLRGPEGVGMLERLVALHQQLREEAAKEAYFREFAAFQADVATIPKNRVAKIKSKGGASYGYPYADFDQIVRWIREPLQKHGLSYSFDTLEETGSLIVTCKVRHQLGHSESNVFRCPIASPNADMPAQHKVAGTYTYAKRYALIGALGLSTAEEDDDGRDVEHEEDEPMLEQEALDLLEERFLGIPGFNRGKFLKHFGVELLKDLRPSRLQDAHKLLDDALKLAQERAAKATP